MAYLGRTRNPDFFYNAKQETVEMAIFLRKRSTLAENLLWKRLRNRQINCYKFRRQHPIEYYVADFYCHELKLVIEVDGPIHTKKDQIEHDQNRSAELDRMGITVLRFTNDEIISKMDVVIERIISTIQSFPSTSRPWYPTSPSPSRRGG